MELIYLSMRSRYYKLIYCFIHSGHTPLILIANCYPVNNHTQWHPCKQQGNYNPLDTGLYLSLIHIYLFCVKFKCSSVIYEMNYCNFTIHIMFCLDVYKRQPLYFILCCSILVSDSHISIYIEKCGFATIYF